MGYQQSLAEQPYTKRRPTDSVIYRNPYRLRRMAKLMTIIDQVVAAKGTCEIVDIGGRYDFWKGLKELWDDRPIKVTLVDLVPTPVEDPRFVSIEGNACNLSAHKDMSFDVVFSNSVLEHVGNWANKELMAKEIRRLAPHHFVQTPNYWFPVEPHFRALFFHWLPRPLQRALVMRRDFAFHARTQSFTEAYRMIEDAELLDYAEMGYLFPDSRIERERVAGVFTKSLVAVR